MNQSGSTEDLGLAAHCRRVAALAAELSDRLQMPAAEREVLEKAALLHHAPIEMLREGSSERLFTDLLGEDWQRLVDGGQALKAIDPSVLRVLSALRRRSLAAKTDEPAALAGIVELCGFFDERIEFLPYEARTEEQVLKELGWMAGEGIHDPEVVATLASLRQVERKDLVAAIQRLPVYPQVALDLLSLVPEDARAVEDLARIASRDQILAGQVMKSANSAVFGTREEISDIRHAIAFLGPVNARQVMMVAALGPLFASKSLHELWEHSLETAPLAERLATLAGWSEPAVAYLAGLVHDVGRLAIQQLFETGQEVFHRLVERGCAPVFAELVVCGLDHGEAGAEALRLWAFPERLVTAVRFHHEPERTSEKLASVLYLAEHWAGSEEDLPSVARLHHAIQTLGLTPEALRPALQGSRESAGPEVSSPD